VTERLAERVPLRLQLLADLVDLVELVERGRELLDADLFEGRRSPVGTGCWRWR
jgi:hypothetical protein